MDGHHLPPQNVDEASLRDPRIPLLTSRQAIRLPWCSAHSVRIESMVSRGSSLSHTFRWAILPMNASLGSNPPPTESCSCPITNIPPPGGERRKHLTGIVWVHIVNPEDKGEITTSNLVWSRFMCNQEIKIPSYHSTRTHLESFSLWIDRSRCHWVDHRCRASRIPCWPSTSRRCGATPRHWSVRRSSPSLHSPWRQTCKSNTIRRDASGYCMYPVVIFHVMELFVLSHDPCLAFTSTKRSLENIRCKNAIELAHKWQNVTSVH